MSKRPILRLFPRARTASPTQQQADDKKQHDDEQADEASKESFPASDPPARY